MKFFLIAMMMSSGLCSAAPARDDEPRVRLSARHLEHDERENLRAERRERMRTLREEMLRFPPRTKPLPARDEDERPRPPERRESRRPPLNEVEQPSRFSPEERRVFRRKLRDAYRDKD